MIECNFTPWVSGNTGLVWWNTLGFESVSGQRIIYLEASFFFLQYCKVFHFFLFFAYFLLVKNTYKNPYSLKSVETETFFVSTIPTT
jgi:hypothetical protein